VGKCCLQGLRKRSRSGWRGGGWPVAVGSEWDSNLGGFGRSKNIGKERKNLKCASNDSKSQWGVSCLAIYFHEKTEPLSGFWEEMRCS